MAKCQEVRLITVVALVGNSSGRRTIIRNDITSSSLSATQGGTAVVRSQNAPAQSAKRSQKGRIKSSTVAIYASVFVLLVSVIAVGYRAPEQSAVVSTGYANVAEPSDNLNVNEVVATRIASSVAENTNMPIAGYIREKADSAEVLSIYANTTNEGTASSPVVVAVSSASRGITQYSVVEGDTVTSIAGKFGLSQETVKWANNLTDDSVAAGSTIDILPRNGITYVVKDGDTLQGLASKYQANAELIVSANDLEISGLTTGLKIVIPEGVLPTTERPGYTAPAIRYNTGFVTGVGTWSGQVLSMSRFYGVNANDGGYAAGNCTAWAFYRRAQMGTPIPGNLGNANTWATKAKSQGIAVNSIPSVGAVIQAGMHVGVVEEIYPNGDLRISDMNYGYLRYNLASRVIPASTIKNYAFIH